VGAHLHWLSLWRYDLYRKEPHTMFALGGEGDSKPALISARRIA
jgi:hypothetical protein